MQQKLKAAGLLLSLMLVILCTATSLNGDVQKIDQTKAYLHANRIKPGVDLICISKSIHAKRLLLANQLMSKSLVPSADLTVALNQYDVIIRDRLCQFEKMKLTEREARWLSIFKRCWSQGVGVEKTVLRLIETGNQKIAIQVANKQGLPLSRQSAQLLQKLTQIQSETGYKAAKKAHCVATLLLSIPAVIGLLTLTFIQRVKTLNHPPSHCISI